MQASLARLEATRPQRAKQHFARLSPEDKTHLLESHHPDYRSDAFAEILVGKNKGGKAPRELVRLLHGRSLIDPCRIDLSTVDHDVDVLVIGAGGGGATAALFAHESGASVLVATKLRLGDSNTTMAEGGIAAAVYPNDTPMMHYVDTMGGGRYANLPDLVSTLVLDAPLIVEWLEGLGVMFDRRPDGDLAATIAGGHSRFRVSSCKDYSGLEVMRVIRDEIRNQAIEVEEFSAAVELLLDDRGRCAGAVLLNLDTNVYSIVRAKATILATGGLGRLHVQDFPTTNHYGATADGLVIGYRAGAEMVYVDTVQFHPTGVAWPEQMFGWLISEVLRGKGAQLVNRDGQRFIHELESRDTVSSAIIRECDERQCGINSPTGAMGVWLDVPLIDVVSGKGTITHHLAGICRRFQQYNIDVEREPILVYPTQHYQNGGILIDREGRTNVPNLYAAGEVSGGVHGRNRLGGNSLTDIFVFGRRAGLHAGQMCKDVRPAPLSLEHVRTFQRELEMAGVALDVKSPMLLPDYTRPETQARKFQ
ncbi:MAG: FAD-binding protein [Chloroflexi bacterium]|nr:FAD-binding protein [Chloroflexota bacterium]